MSRTLGFVTPMRAYAHDGRLYTHVASGRVLERLAARYDRVLVTTRVVHGPPASDADLPLDATNVVLHAQPFWPTIAGATRHLSAIVRCYRDVCRDADHVFVRGLCPGIVALYFWAFWYRCRVCHWIVGDTVGVLQTRTRRGLTERVGLLYARFDRVASRVGRWAVDGAFVCNGVALASAYASPRTVSTASSAVAGDEFHVRTDTCQGPVVRLLYLGYLRPEKGLEYLFTALAALRLNRPWQLDVVGPAETPAHQASFERHVESLGLASRVAFHGYVPYGPAILDYLRAADMLVLPSLSEGTPHVLVEARANGLPCVATRVGGVPSVVIDRVDALLVPPRDAVALAAAIERVVNDGALRRSLIRNGLERARQQTVDAFVVHVADALDGAAAPAHPRS